MREHLRHVLGASNWACPSSRGTGIHAAAVWRTSFFSIQIFTSISRYQNASELFGAFFLQHDNTQLFIFSQRAPPTCISRAALRVDPRALVPTFSASLFLSSLAVSIAPCSHRGTDGQTRFVARGNHGGMGGPSDTGSTMATQHDTSLSPSLGDGDGAPSAVHKRVTRSSAAAAAAATAAEVRPACGAWCLTELR